MKKIVLTIICLFLLINTFADNIIEVEGKVQIRKGRNALWEDAVLNDRINTSYSVRTMHFSRASIKLYDGSVLRLDPDTLVTRKSRDSYFVNGLTALSAKNVNNKNRIVFQDSYMDFEQGEFVISANSNMLWGISNSEEFWAKGPSGRVRVLANYQTIITDENGPVEPEPASMNRIKFFKKAKINDLGINKEAPKDELFQYQSFYIKFRDLKVCNISVGEKSELFLNKDDLVRNKVIISGVIDDTQAKDISRMQISLDGGKTFNDADGVSPFRFEFSPEIRKKYLIKIKAKDHKNTDSGQTFMSVKMTYINENDRMQIEKYMKDMVEYLRNEEYSGVMAYFDSKRFKGDMQSLSDQIIDFFYKYDYFYIRYDIRNFLKFDNNIELGIDWEYDITETDNGNTSQKKGFTLFRFEKNAENRWRIVDLLDGTLYGIERY